MNEQEIQIQKIVEEYYQEDEKPGLVSENADGSYNLSFQLLTRRGGLKRSDPKQAHETLRTFLVRRYNFDFFKAFRSACMIGVFSASLLFLIASMAAAAFAIFRLATSIFAKI